MKGKTCRKKESVVVGCLIASASQKMEAFERINP
jgi:hypothetical protein